MHGQRQLEEWQHMLPEPIGLPGSLLIFDPDVSHLTHFFKDDRKINLGDCALFKAEHGPPLIGIIHKLIVDENGNLKLVVNWLYRPGNVKLPKEYPLDTAPNEIFYSFHRDEIPAIALLHPCKVAFLQKSVKLPEGISSFVCRRVYDTANKRLRWLTDQDYIDEHQEEVNRVLDRTRQEMQATVQTAGSSSRAVSSQQPKGGASESAQNGSVSSHGKGKKRERTEQELGHSKREKTVKSEESDTCHSKSKREHGMEELSEITDNNGALVCVSSVDQLVNLMKQEKSDNRRKAINRRSVLAGVIASTNGEECLHRFVELGGLPMLHDWLQEAHKCKTNDSGSPKDGGGGDKGLEELLLILLRALDKLPIDLDALKSCLVGKSVNNLRSHKNIQVQRNARKLVDTWKKRVDAEMKLSAISSPVKPDSVKPCLAKVGSGSGSKVHTKNSSLVKSGVNGSHPSKALSSQSLQGISSSVSSKEHHHKKLHVHTMAMEAALSSSAKDERSSSSGHSQNNSQSFSSSGKGSSGRPVKAVEHTQTSGRGNGDAGKSPSQHRKKTHTSEKIITSGCVNTSLAHSPKIENASNQRLILRLPNPGRGLTCTAQTSVASSPNLSEKHDSERKTRTVHSPVGSTNNGQLEAVTDEKTGQASLQIDASKLPSEGLEVENIKSNPPAMLINHAHADVRAEGHGMDDEEGGIDILASVAASENSEEEKGTENNGIDSKEKELADHNHALGDRESMNDNVKIDTKCKEGDIDTCFEDSALERSEVVSPGNDFECQGKAGEIELTVIGELVEVKTDQSFVESQQQIANMGGEKSDSQEKSADIVSHDKVEDIYHKADNVRRYGQGGNQESANVCKTDNDERALEKISVENRETETKEASVIGEGSLELPQHLANEVEKKAKVDNVMLERDSGAAEAMIEINGHVIEVLDRVEKGVSDTKIVMALGEADRAVSSIADNSKLDHIADKAVSGLVSDVIGVHNDNKGETIATWTEVGSNVGGSDSRGRPLFDLNEEGIVDETIEDIGIPSMLPLASLPSSSHPAEDNPISLATPNALLNAARQESETEWNNAQSRGHSRALHIDLNVADERLFEDSSVTSLLPLRENACGSNLSFSSRPVLDLNIANQTEESPYTSELKHTEGSISLLKARGKCLAIRDFDLNDGPSSEGGEESMRRHLTGANVGLSALPGLLGVGYKMNSEAENLSSWSASDSIPLPEAAYTFLPTLNAKQTGLNPFSADVYHSKCTVSYSTTAPNSYSYTGLPMVSNFPFSATTLTENSGAIGSPFARPYAMGAMQIAGGSNSKSNSNSNHTWLKSSLDLNSGPDSLKLNMRDGITRGGNSLKRLEPESGFDPFLSGYTQSMHH